MPNMFRLRVGLRIRGSFGDVLLRRGNQSRESIRIVHSHVRQYFPVQLDAAHFQSVNQLAVGDAVVAGSRADALNPQRTVVALANPAVTVGVPQRAVHRFFCRPIKFSLGEEKTFCVLQQLFASRASFGSTFNSRHSSISYCAPRRRIYQNLGRLQHGDTNLAGWPQKSADSRTGLSRRTAVTLSRIVLVAGAIGRQAPVTLCLAR